MYYSKRENLVGDYKFGTIYIKFKERVFTEVYLMNDLWYIIVNKFMVTCKTKYDKISEKKIWL